MNIYDDYQKRAMTTLIPENANTNYTLQGIMGEYGEAIEKLDDPAGWTPEDIKKELGDVYWYCATSCELLGKPFSEVVRSVTKADLQVFNLDKIILQAFITGSKIIELNKKANRQSLTNQQESAIISYIGDITSDLDFMRQYYNLGSLEGIFNLNVSKLAQRKLNNTLKGQGDNR